MQTSFKFLLVVFVFFFVLSSAPCSAYYVIELKTGSNIIVQKYWKENGQIKFYHHGGLVGIAADTVLNIRDADTIEFERIADFLKGTDAHTDTPGGSGAISGDNEQEVFEDQVAIYQAELVRINAEVSLNADHYRVAKEQNNRESMREAMRRMSDLRENRRELHQKVLKLYDGEIPEWWTN